MCPFKVTCREFQWLKTGKTTVVMSGCAAKFTEYNLILPNKDEEVSCTTYWKSSSGKEFSLSRLIYIKVYRT